MSHAPTSSATDDNVAATLTGGPPPGDRCDNQLVKANLRSAVVLGGWGAMAVTVRRPLLTVCGRESSYSQTDACRRNDPSRLHHVPTGNATSEPRVQSTF